MWYLTEFLDCYYLFSVFPFLVRFAVGLFVVFTLLIFFWILQVCINFCICVVVWHVVIVVVRVFWLASMNTFDSAAKERAITRNVVYNIWNFVDCCTSLVFCFAVFLLRIVGRSFYISIFVDEICKWFVGFRWRIKEADVGIFLRLLCLVWKPGIKVAWKLSFSDRGSSM